MSDKGQKSKPEKQEPPKPRPPERKDLNSERTGPPKNKR
jgi:hypothetical protein